MTSQRESRQSQMTHLSHLVGSNAVEWKLHTLLQEVRNYTHANTHNITHTHTHKTTCTQTYTHTQQQITILSEHYLLQRIRQLSLIVVNLTPSSLLPSNAHCPPPPLCFPQMPTAPLLSASLKCPLHTHVIAKSNRFHLYYISITSTTLTLSLMTALYMYSSSCTCVSK